MHILKMTYVHIVQHQVIPHISSGQNGHISPSNGMNLSADNMTIVLDADIWEQGAGCANTQQVDALIPQDGLRMSIAAWRKKDQPTFDGDSLCGVNCVGVIHDPVPF